MSIMRDVTEEEKRRSKKEENNRTTVEIADKVILKQMRVVQRNCFPSGRNGGGNEEIALENLKRTLDNDDLYTDIGYVSINKFGNSSARTGSK